MRIPRQSRWTAAVRAEAAENASKRLAGGRNPRSAISNAWRLGRGRQQSHLTDGTGFKQSLPWP
jgi:hypothetical protein